MLPIKHKLLPSELTKKVYAAYAISLKNQATAARGRVVRLIVPTSVNLNDNNSHFGCRLVLIFDSAQMQVSVDTQQKDFSRLVICLKNLFYP